MSGPLIPASPSVAAAARTPAGSRSRNSTSSDSASTLHFDYSQRPRPQFLHASAGTIRRSGEAAGRMTLSLPRTASDGRAGMLIAIERPFFSLDTRWSTGSQYLRRTIRSRTSTGSASRSLDTDEQGRIRRVQVRPVQRSRERLDAPLHPRVYGAMIRPSSTFAPDETAPLSRCPRIGTSTTRSCGSKAYRTTSRRRAICDQIARTEDRHFGMRYALELGWADSRTRVGPQRGLVARGGEPRIFGFGDDNRCSCSVRLTGRVESGSAGGYPARRPDCAITIQTGRRTACSLPVWAPQVGQNLDADHELSLGGDNGLRGYPLRFQTGSSRALLTLEERYYTKYSLWKTRGRRRRGIFRHGPDLGRFGFRAHRKPRVAERYRHSGCASAIHAVGARQRAAHRHRLPARRTRAPSTTCSS